MATETEAQTSCVDANGICRCVVDGTMTNVAVKCVNAASGPIIIGLRRPIASKPTPSTSTTTSTTSSQSTTTSTTLSQSTTISQTTATTTISHEKTPPDLVCSRDLLKLWLN